MGINRGDRFDYMNSMSFSGRRQGSLRAPGNSRRSTAANRLEYITGDMNTSLIRTVKGRTIMVQHDTTTPRPYSRHNLIQGTNGVFAGFPNRIALEEGGSGSFHEWDYDMSAWRERYDHPLWVRMGPAGRGTGRPRRHGPPDVLAAGALPQERRAAGPGCLRRRSLVGDRPDQRRFGPPIAATAGRYRISPGENGAPPKPCR